MKSLEKNKISIIIPIYNVEQYLSRCVDSVINQSYKNLEIILVDDGSTDNCGKICDEYALKDNRIKVIHKQNGGVSSARNVGLDIATGDYIGFVDSDDFIEKDMYEFLYNLLLENDADISCCNRFDFVNDKYLPSVSFPGEGFLSLNDLLQGHGWGFSIWNKLFDKNLVKNIRFDENISLGEDLLFCFKVLENNKKILFRNIAKYYYCYNNNSVIYNLTRKNVFNEKFLGNILVYDYIIKYAKKNKLSVALKKYRTSCLNYVLTFLVNIAVSNDIEQNKNSLSFLLKYARKNLFHYIFGKFTIKAKVFILISCINFNLASKIYKFIKNIGRRKNETINSKNNS